MNFLTSKTLNNGVEMPRLGFGVFQSGGDTKQAALWALEAGYRHIDTAKAYHNEDAVGEAIKESGIDRKELFITTKLWNQDMRDHTQRENIEKSLEYLQTDYLDLLLIHWPVAGVYKESWKIMEEFYKEGKIRAIGLSNFSIEEMKAAMKYGDVDVIQPCYSLLWRYDEDLVKFSAENNVSVIPYSTLAQGLLTGKYKKDAVFTDGRAKAALFQPENYNRCLEVTDVLSEVSAKYGKTPAQGAIAWLLQTPGITAPIVGAKNGKQAEENIQASGWKFSEEDYEIINAASKKFTDSLPNYTLFFNTETAD